MLIEVVGSSERDADTVDATVCSVAFEWLSSKQLLVCLHSVNGERDVLVQEQAVCYLGVH